MKRDLENEFQLAYVNNNVRAERNVVEWQLIDSEDAPFYDVDGKNFVVVGDA